MRRKIFKSELARLFNISKATIRHYEDKKIIFSEEDENGYKLYDWKDVERLDIVLFLKSLGVSLNDIKRYIDDDNDMAELLQSKSEYIDNEINKLLKIKNRIDGILKASDENTVLGIVKETVIKERKFFVLQQLEDNNIKHFYDYVGDLYNIISGFNEVFILLHQNYNNESNFFEDSKVLLQYDDNIKDTRLKEIIIPSAKYLVINYIYEDLNDFKLAYNKILEYTHEKGLKLDKNSFLEIEHKDYNILHKKKMYELQFKIEDK